MGEWHSSERLRVPHLSTPCCDILSLLLLHVPHEEYLRTSPPDCNADVLACASNSQMQRDLHNIMSTCFQFLEPMAGLKGILSSVSGSVHQKNCSFWLEMSSTSSLPSHLGNHVRVVCTDGIHIMGQWVFASSFFDGGLLNVDGLFEGTPHGGIAFFVCGPAI